jgi:hypothetical protein
MATATTVVGGAGVSTPAPLSLGEQNQDGDGHRDHADLEGGVAEDRD